MITIVKDDGAEFEAFRASLPSPCRARSAPVKGAHERGSWGTAHVRAVRARRPARGRARPTRGRAKPRPQAAARQAAGATAGAGSGHQGGSRGAGDAQGRERGCCQGRRRSRCRRAWRAFERGTEPPLHRLRSAAVRDGRRAGEAPDLRQVPRAEAADDLHVRHGLPGEPWCVGAARGVPQEAEEATEEE